MRVTFVLWLSMALSLQLAASNSNGQGIDSEVSIEFRNVTLSEALRILNNKSGVTLVYAPDMVKEYANINLSLNKRTVRQVLDLLLANTDLEYLEKGKAVIIRRRQITFNESDDSNNIQNYSPFLVSGKITDVSTGEPLTGVNILVKGTTRGTNSDASGRYSIEVSANETLVYSFIGFKTIEILVGNQTAIDVPMPTDATALKEVQIISTNYFSTTKEKSTMNISRVDGKEIENQPVTSLLNSVVGRIPGLDITPENGFPGSAPTVRIRGNNSLSAFGSFPLYVIDGVQIDSNPLKNAFGSSATSGTDPLTSISPADIESIEVLKDAAATAIYGSRGANGVIRITTKRAKHGSGKTDFDFNIYTGVGKIVNKVDLLNRDQYLKMRKEAYVNNDLALPVADDFISDITGVWDTTRSTDWQDVLLGGTANITDVQGSFSGGSEHTSFRIGGGYHKETTVYPADDSYQRANSDFSFQHFSQNKKLELSASVNFGWVKNRSFNNSQFVNLALTLPPVAPKLHNADGTLNWELYPYFDGTFIYHSWTNPLAALLYRRDITSNSLISNAVLAYELLPGLKARTSFSLSSITNDASSRNPIAAQEPYFQPTATGRMTFNDDERRSFMIEPQLMFERNFDNHHLNAIIGTTWQQVRSDYRSLEGQGYPSDALLGSILGAPTLIKRADDHNQYRYASVYAHIGYDYKGKYLIDVTGRRDGSSRFGPGKRYGNFGAIGAGWIFSEELLVKNILPVLSFGKIRGSYGITGNDQIGDYQYLNTYNIRTAGPGYQNGISLIPTALYNPNYAWETTNKLEFGIELGLVKNRIMIEGAWYKNRSSNQLITSTLAASTGFPSVLENYPATVENTGLEIVLTTLNFAKDNFRWTTSVNLSVPTNKLVKFDGIESSPYATVYKVGEPLTIQRLYTYKGINSGTGLYELEDLDEDGFINQNDLRFMDPLGRKAFGGINNSILYKNFELSFLFQLSNSRLNNRLPTDMPGTMANQPIEILNRWREEGDKAEYQKFYPRSGAVSSNYSNVKTSNHNITDGSFMRLKTLSISYRFPSDILSKVKLQDGQIYFQCQNLFTITKYKGLDPETGNSMPPLKMLSVGLRLKL